MHISPAFARYGILNYPLSRQDTVAEAGTDHAGFCVYRKGITKVDSTKGAIVQIGRFHNHPPEGGLVSKLFWIVAAVLVGLAWLGREIPQSDFPNRKRKTLSPKVEELEER